MIARRRPRILHIFGRLNRGGAELRTLDLLRQPDCRQVHLEFGVLSGLPGDLDGEIERQGGTVHPCRLNWSFPWRFSRLLRERRIDAVHSHVQLFSGYILRCAARAGVPVRIAHFRTVSSGHKLSWRRRLQEAWMRRELDRSATLILGNGHASLSRGWREAWTGDCRCAVLHNGLDTSQFAIAPDREEVRAEFGWPADCPLTIHVGRMDPAKNHGRLASMISRIADREPAMRFLLAGRTDETILACLHAQFAEHGLANRVVIAGLRSDIPRLLKAADVMLFPSLREGLPGAVLEAAAAGTPVVGSDLAGIVEIARRFSLVRCLPLSASDEFWAEATIDAAHRIQTASQRERSRLRVDRSVYGIGRCLQAHLLAWTGASGTDLRKLYDSPHELLAGYSWSSSQPVS